MNVYKSFHDQLLAHDVGNKYLNLQKVVDFCNVPMAICIPSYIFKEAIGEASLKRLVDVFSDLNSTVACFILDSIKEIEDIVNNIVMPYTVRQQLEYAIRAEFEYEDNMEFAIRSSSLTEDSYNSSYAGIYQSYLHVQNMDEIINAITECWRSYYSYTAVSARLRNNNFDPEPHMAVIIQQMINSEFAGVAFTTADSIVYVEYVEGEGENLVSGRKTPIKYRSDVNKACERQAEIDDVIDTILCVRKILGYEVDLEWAWDYNGLHVLQVRPITSNIMGIRENSDEPIFFYARLYLDIELPSGMRIDDCSDVYVSYMAKRGKPYRMAEKNNVRNGKGYIFDFNYKGLEQNKDIISNLLDKLDSNKIVIDINNNIRQVIINKNELITYLYETFYSSPQDRGRSCFIFREFIKGQYGLISRIIDRTSLLVEYSPEGLMEINRGIINCHRILIKNINEPLEQFNIEYDFNDNGAYLVKTLPVIISFTNQMNKYKKGTQVEWVIENSMPYFVDFSVEMTKIENCINSECIVISSGIAQGFVLQIKDNILLQRLSIGAAISVTGFHEAIKHEQLNEIYNMISKMKTKPIICADKPYVIFSLLFDHVAGFIFQEGSLLCHLAILLRESHIPAVIHPDYLYNKDDYIIMSNGRIAINNRSC